MAYGAGGGVVAVVVTPAVVGGAGGTAAAQVPLVGTPHVRVSCRTRGGGVGVGGGRAGCSEGRESSGWEVGRGSRGRAMAVLLFRRDFLLPFLFSLRSWRKTCLCVSLW